MESQRIGPGTCYVCLGCFVVVGDCTHPGWPQCQLRAVLGGNMSAVSVLSLTIRLVGEYSCAESNVSFQHQSECLLYTCVCVVSINKSWLYLFSGMGRFQKIHVITCQLLDTETVTEVRSHSQASPKSEDLTCLDSWMYYEDMMNTFPYFCFTGGC